MRYFAYVWGIITNPAATIRRLKDDPKRLLVGFGAVLTLGVLYALTAIVLWGQGIGVESNWIRIPPRQHYLYQSLFNLPVAVMCWLVFSTVVYLLLPRFKIDFDVVLAVIGLPYGILVLPLMWLPETIVAAFAPRIWFDSIWASVTWARVAAGSLWVLVVCITAVKQVYRTSWLRAILVTLIGFIAGAGLSAVFIR